MSAASVPTVSGRLAELAAKRPEDLAIADLASDGTEALALSYAELEGRVATVAASVGRSARPGDRVILLHPTGAQFAIALLGAMRAGAIPALVYPPGPGGIDRALARLGAIIDDLEPALVLTSERMLASLADRLPSSLAALAWLATDTAPVGDTTSVSVAVTAPEDDAALIQFTSGSTGAPKGVVLSHGNLAHQNAAIERSLRTDEATSTVQWLPLFHDMGLFGGLLQPLHAGYPTRLMAPVAFLQRPVRWLTAIARYRATVCGAPNFAYGLCAERVTYDERDELDLTAWRLAFCGAEPVRAATLERFARAFAPAGFSEEAFYPCYGMAEASCGLTGAWERRGARVASFARVELGDGRAVPTSAGPAAIDLVSVGTPLPDTRLEVRAPESADPCPDGMVGEIWATSPSVSRLGYWRRPQETAASFTAVPGGGKPTMLRTGDLGFLHDDELFVTGRLKDVLVVRGRNIAPQDVEASAGASHPSLAPDGAAAFLSGSLAGEERLVVACEVRRPEALVRDDALGAVREAVARDHGLEVHEVVLLQSRRLPRTSSGKVRRNQTRDDFEAGELALAPV